MHYQYALLIYFKSSSKKSNRIEFFESIFELFILIRFDVLSRVFQFETIFDFIFSRRFDIESNRNFDIKSKSRLDAISLKIYKFL